MKPKRTVAQLGSAVAPGALAGYAGTLVMEPVSMKLYELEPEADRQQEDRVRPGQTHQPLQIRRSKLALVGVKAIHTLAWFSIESCMIYLLYAGLRKQSDRRAAIAGAVVVAESLIFAANGFRCPLTTLAEQFGTERGSVTDIYLPRWFAHSLPAIHAPLLVLAGFLHLRNIRSNRSA